MRSTSATMADAARVRDLVHHGRGPILVQAAIAADEPPRVLPSRDGHAIKLRFMQAMQTAGRGPQEGTVGGRGRTSPSDHSSAKKDAARDARDPPAPLTPARAADSRPRFR